jgi:hypothetical protein
MTDSSRRRAQSWIYHRHGVFEKILRKSNADWFAQRGYEVNPHMPYLLEHWIDWPKNIILPEVAQYIQAEQKHRSYLKERFPLHKYIHHGLSSQAMLFNLVGPLVAYGDLSPLKQALEAEGVDWPSGEVSLKFEVEDRNIFNEDSGQPTSIDLVIKGTKNNLSLFIEAKLVEREFGGCSVFQNGDCNGRNPSKDFDYCYLHYIGRQYWILLQKYGFLEGITGNSPICPLALYYQFFRELIFSIESGGEFILLYDKRNPSFFSFGAEVDHGLMPFLISFVPQDLRNRIHSITIQQVVDVFERFEGFDWLLEFNKKYALI